MKANKEGLGLARLLGNLSVCAHISGARPKRIRRERPRESICGRGRGRGGTRGRVGLPGRGNCSPMAVRRADRQPLFRARARHGGTGRSGGNGRSDGGSVGSDDNRARWGSRLFGRAFFFCSIRDGQGGGERA